MFFIGNFEEFSLHRNISRRTANCRRSKQNPRRRRPPPAPTSSKSLCSLPHRVVRVANRDWVTFIPLPHHPAAFVLPPPPFPLFQNRSIPRWSSTSIASPIPPPPRANAPPFLFSSTSPPRATYRRTAVLLSKYNNYTSTGRSIRVGAQKRRRKRTEEGKEQARESRRMG